MAEHCVAMVKCSYELELYLIYHKPENAASQSARANPNKMNPVAEAAGICVLLYENICTYTVYSCAHKHMCIYMHVYICMYINL